MRSMKILSIAAVLLGLGFNASAAEQNLPKFKEGKWKGTVIDSIDVNLKNKTVTATSEVVEKNKVKITVVTEGAKGYAKEEWIITPKELIQTEYKSNGKVDATYKADYRLNKKGNIKSEELTYDIHCANKQAKKCDNNIDPNNSWTIKAKGNKLTYVVHGLKNKKDPASLGDRHVFEFQYAGRN